MIRCLPEQYMFEVLTAFCVEEMKVSRNRGTLIVTVLACIVGAFCSLSLGSVDISLAGYSLFDLFDFVTGQILLPVGGFLTCLFLGWGVKRQLVYDEFFTGFEDKSGRSMVSRASGRFLFQFYLFLIRFVCPVAIAAIFLHQFGAI